MKTCFRYLQLPGCLLYTHLLLTWYPNACSSDDASDNNMGSRHKSWEGDRLIPMNNLDKRLERDALDLKVYFCNPAK